MSDITDYLDLVPSANQSKPKFIAMLTVIAQTFVDNINLCNSIPSKYDIDDAVGTQLDVVGQWVGLSRRLNVPISGVYFSFDIDGVGFDEGVWKGPFDPDEGLVSLDDDTYRLMLYIKIAANNWDGSLAQAQEILARIFATSPGTMLFIQDNFDMTMTVGLSGVVPNALFTALLVGGYITLRPAGVLIDEIIVTSVSGDPIFGFDADNSYIAGFDEGAWGTVLSS